jgi:hypothetical protein
MSVLIINIIPEGIIVGTDRLMRWTDHQGNVGYSEGFKVMRWPNRRAIVGYVGTADLGGTGTRNSTFEWLSDFIGENHDFGTLAELARTLSDRVQEQYNSMAFSEDELFLLELTGFRIEPDGTALPEVWHITNAHSIVDGTYADIDNAFGCSEECLSKYGALAPNMRQTLALLPFWVHQTADFGLLNSLSGRLDEFFVMRQQIFGINPTLEPPEFDRFEEFENRVRMKILAYATFHESFESPLNRAVGGGCDVLSLEWPERSEVL